MAIRYVPEEFESKWRDLWEKEGIYQTRSPKGSKYYTLVMFPYPSGSGLHVGHARIYTGADVLARYLRMKGESILYPMGWDALGLPAENAAIKEKKNPMDMVPENIKMFKDQMKILGLSYDWNKELSTSDPSYYQWTQWLFIQFFKMGLLYKKDTEVFFCEYCKTGLAEEEVLPDGTHERCGNPITHKILPQWIFKITAFAERLLNDLEGLDWPEGILTMQRKWIGKKEGMTIRHKACDIDVEFETFTAYPAWSFADTFIVIAPEHPLVNKLVENTPQESEVKGFIEETRKISPQDRIKESYEKKGIFTGRYAKDPFGGKDMPIWVANFAMLDFGTGIVRCSAHDPRDYAFAMKYHIPIKEVVERESPSEPVNAHSQKGTLKDSGPFTGREVSTSTGEIKKWILENNIGQTSVAYHLRDWIFSRQRYWGEPIPMIYCEACRKSKDSFFTQGKEFGKYLSPKDKENMLGWYPLEEKELPLKLPYVKSYEPSPDGSSPLSQIPDFVSTTCPRCHGRARRETDTMPNWAGSCWYFLAFPWWNGGVAVQPAASAISSHIPSPSLDNWNKYIRKSIDEWLPVDWYVGGAEHAVLHLLYTRFWVKALEEIGLLGFGEPFLKLRNVGMVGGVDDQKMSKSRGNVINPNDVVREYGADTVRVYEMFMAPFSQDIGWSTQALQGSYRFLVRIWQIYKSSDKITDDTIREDKELNAELQRLILKITDDLTNVKYNTCIAFMMTFLNQWEKGGMLSQQHAGEFLQLLAPFAPYIAEELWMNKLGKFESIHTSQWPVQEEQTESQPVTIVVQVSGKTRGILKMKVKDLTQETVTQEALNIPSVKKYVEDKKYEIIYIPNRAINFVVS